MATREVTMDILMTELSYMLGELTVPTSGVDPRKTFLQRSLEDAWKEFPWPFSLNDDTISFSSGVADMPDEFLPEGRVTISDAYGVIPQIDYEERLVTADAGWYLAADDGSYTAKLVNHADFTGDIRYQFTPPDLTDGTSTCPYPNPKTIAKGAMRMTVVADNPEADNSTQIEEFQQDLESDYSAFARNARRNRRVRTITGIRGHIIGEA